MDTNKMAALGVALIAGLWAGGSAAQPPKTAPEARTGQNIPQEGLQCVRTQSKVAECIEQVGRARGRPLGWVDAFRACNTAVTGGLYDCTEQRDLACGADVLGTVFTCEAAKVSLILAASGTTGVGSLVLAVSGGWLAVDCVVGIHRLFEKGCLRWPEREVGYRPGPSAIADESPAASRSRTDPLPLGVGEPATTGAEGMPSVPISNRIPVEHASRDETLMYWEAPPMYWEAPAMSREPSPPGSFQTSVAMMIRFAFSNSPEVIVTPATGANQLDKLLPRMRALRFVAPKPTRHRIDRFAGLDGKASTRPTTAKLTIHD